MSNIAIIGAGVSGLSTAQILKQQKHQVTVYEKENQPGGLIRCKNVDGSLFHICGGHVFNSKRKDVLDWFWDRFDRESEFSKADRRAVVFFDEEKKVPYPIENHMYLLDTDTQKSFIKDLFSISVTRKERYENFEDFLQNRFGLTLYSLYFKPYNKKIWRRDLNKVPISWLEGKLPMPTVEDMIYNNMNHIEEKQFVHSTFWYEKNKGSQFIADRLAEGLNIQYNSDIQEIVYQNQKWKIDGKEYDLVVFCGNIKDLPKIVKNFTWGEFEKDIDNLEYHGTTSVFCEITPNPYSWIYLPNKDYEAHRIICTGNFAESNNGFRKMTATIEFTDAISEEEIKENLKKIPLQPQYITHHYNQYTYPIQDHNTREMIKNLKGVMKEYNFYFTGRFADWEYYNMDVAIGAAMDTCKNIFLNDGIKEK